MKYWELCFLIANLWAIASIFKPNESLGWVAVIFFVLTFFLIIG
jgi:hypothetical protein